MSNQISDYKKVERGEMSEEDFKSRHGQTTKSYEDQFMDQFGIDLVNSEETEVYERGKEYMRGLVKKKYNEGGMVVDDMEIDPISGNHIPTGSAPEEVRDDVDAKLSEGEFVIPANVVQYFGVKYFDGLIKKAEEKLESIPKGEPIPEEEMVMEEELAYNEGGMVPTQVEPPAMQMAQDQPGYGYRTYYGPNGQTMEILFFNGEPQNPIPAGYTTTKPEVRRPNTGNVRNEPRRTRPSETEVQEDMYSALDEVDFSNDDNVLEWANDQLVNPQTNNAGLLGRFLPGGLLGVAKEARGIAEVNAAARVARAQGNDALADELESRVGAVDSVATRMLPSAWIDGDQIAANYTAKRRNSDNDSRPSLRKGANNSNSGLPTEPTKTQSSSNTMKSSPRPQSRDRELLDSIEPTQRKGYPR